MTRVLLALAAAALAVTAAACNLPTTTRLPVFIGGRAVTAVGDTLFAVTLPDHDGVLLFGRNGVPRDTLGADVLVTPVELQWVAGRWYVSDVVDGEPLVRVFGAGGRLEKTIRLAEHTEQFHQFAALTDGRIVVETSDGRLVAVADDSVATFVPTDVSARPSLLLATQDGVLHAVPDRTITLYNRFGRIRWRVEWPWIETAHVSDLAADARGRIHVLSGVADEGTFIVYTLEPTSGEVVRWSETEPRPTFVVDKWGAVTLDETGRWDAGRSEGAPQ